jgi:L-fucose mutarotase
MLKGIPDILSPELLKILMEMRHTDEIVIADGNFPAGEHPQRVVRLDGYGVPELRDAILTFYPLDRYVDAPVTLMAVLPGDPVVPVIWDEYKAIIARHEENIRCKKSIYMNFMSLPAERMRWLQPRKARCMQISF